MIQYINSDIHPTYMTISSMTKCEMGGWQEGGGETQITLNVLHRNTYDTKNPPNQL